MVPEDDVDNFLVGLVFSASNFLALRTCVARQDDKQKRVVEADLNHTYDVAKSHFEAILSQVSQDKGHT